MNALTSETTISKQKEVFKAGSITRKRRKILNEIYETEKTYQYHLMLLTTLFLEPIRVASVLPLRVIDGMFSNVEAIQSVSAHLLRLMEEQGITHALKELAPYMKLYSLYANNFDFAHKLLEEYQANNADFARLLKYQESREEMQSLKFNALLLTPIQRVPRYRLLLVSLLEKTFEDDPDYPKLIAAYETISKVTTHINECVRQHENFNKMLAIQNSFTGNSAPRILTPGRSFIREGTVTKITDHGNAKERVLFLFNDLLLCAKKVTSCTYRCNDIYDLTDCIVVQVMGSLSNGNGLFKIINKDRSLLLCSKASEICWINAIKSAIKNLHTNLASLKRLDDISTQTVKEKKKSSAKVKSPSKNFQPPSSSVKLRRLLGEKPALSHANVSKKWTNLPEIATVSENTTDITNGELFYRMSSSVSSEKHETQNFSIYNEELYCNTLKKTDSSPQNHIMNWTLSEPHKVQSRRPLHSFTNGAKTFGGKLGCSTTTSKKRRIDRCDSPSSYSEESPGRLQRKPNEKIQDSTPSSQMNKPLIENASTNQSNGCLLM